MQSIAVSMHALYSPAGLLADERRSHAGIADHFWVVPNIFIRPFVDLVGTRLNLSHYSKCCFAKRCIQKAGHGCYNVLAAKLGGDHIGFCWPQPARSIAEPNPNYQCCRHGGAVIRLDEGTKSPT